MKVILEICQLLKTCVTIKQCQADIFLVNLDEFIVFTFFEDALTEVSTEELRQFHELFLSQLLPLKARLDIEHVLYALHV
jgi:hypothetical protein